jgi:hypothetical protein
MGVRVFLLSEDITIVNILAGVLRKKASRLAQGTPFRRIGALQNPRNFANIQRNYAALTSRKTGESMNTAERIRRRFA